MNYCLFSYLFHEIYKNNPCSALFICQGVQAGARGIYTPKGGVKNKTLIK